MGWSFKIGTIGGRAIRVHFTFALLLVWIWLTYYRIGGAPAAWQGIAFTRLDGFVAWRLLDWPGKVDATLMATVERLGLRPEPGVVSR